MKIQIFRHIAVVALMTMLLAGLAHWQLSENYNQRQRLECTRQLSLIRGSVEHALAQSFLFLEGIGNFISITPDFTEEQFQAYAALILEKQHLLKNIAAAPDLVLSYVYPLEGNRAILGKDYREMPNQWPDVEKAISSGKLVTAGPLKLLQGGTGLIGRVPVFIARDESHRLWGIVSSVLDMDKLYKTVGIQRSGLSVALRKKGAPPQTFYGDPALFSPEARSVLLSVPIPGANWELAAVPEKGWSLFPAHILAVDLLMILLGIGAGFWRVKSIQKNHAILEARKSLDMSQALSHLGSWSLNLKTGALWWSDETYRIFGLDKDATDPTMDIVMGMIPEADRERVNRVIEKAVAECGKYTIEHRIIPENREIAHVEARGYVHCGPDGTAQKFTGTILDITPRKTAENELVAREKQMRAMARASHDAMIMIDTSDRILFWSDRAEKMFGWTPQEAMGQSMHRLITLPEDCEKALEGLKHFSRSGTGPVIGSVMEFSALRKDGSIIPVERSVASFQLDGAHYAVGSLRDISDRKRKEEQLKVMATTDSLTGLNNRRRFMELLLRELKKSQRYQVPFSVLTFDADKFKRINDTFGHEAGDRVLMDIARVTHTTMRKTDFHGRLGGEEFAVGLPHTDLEGAINLAERLRAAFEASAVVTEEGHILHYTVSLGVTCCPPGDTIEMETLMKQADIALYRAKENGRNIVEAYSSDGNGP